MANIPANNLPPLQILKNLNVEFHPNFNVENTSLDKCLDFLLSCDYKNFHIALDTGYDYACIIIKALNLEIITTLDEISKAKNYSKFLLNEICETSYTLAKCNLELSRYESLKTQYKADIKRLAFILEGELNSKAYGKNPCCPFCNSTPKISNPSSFIDSAEMELKKIVYLLEDLHGVINNIILERKSLENHILNLNEELVKIENLINSILNPHLDFLKNTLASRKLSLEIKDSRNIIKTLEKTMIMYIK